MRQQLYIVNNPIVIMILIKNYNIIISEYRIINKKFINKKIRIIPFAGHLPDHIVYNG